MDRKYRRGEYVVPDSGIGILFQLSLHILGEMMTKRKKQQDQGQQSKEGSSLTETVRRGQNPAGEDGIEWQPLQKENRRILFDVFFNKNKTAYLDYLKKIMPAYLNLRHSFWENQHFLRWQLLRLNPEYQTIVEKIWHDKWTSGGITEQQEIEEYFFDFRDCIPRKIDTYQTWEFAGWLGKDKTGKTRLPINIAKLMEKWKVAFPPIPWVFRFTPRGYLDQLPLLPEYDHWKSKRGRPIEDLAKNLLIYELSKVGMKNMEIARLIFGVRNSTEFWLDQPKHPILVKIAKMKIAMDKLVSESYRF